MLKNTRAMTSMAILGALSIVLVFLIHFPIFPTAAFLEYDPADIPVLVCAFAYGPLAGFIVTIIASAIQALTVSAGSGLYGFLMHVIATTALCVPAGFIYKHDRTKLSAVIALVVGTLCMGCVMMVANHFITPIFMGAPTEVVDAMLLPTILPFNLIKAGINSIVTFLVYKPISKYVLKTAR